MIFMEHFTKSLRERASTKLKKKIQTLYFNSFFRETLPSLPLKSTKGLLKFDIFLVQSQEYELVQY